MRSIGDWTDCAGVAARWQRGLPCAGAVARQRAAFVLVAVVVTIARLQADAAERLSLQEALELARRNNPDVLAARQELEVARGRLVKARYWNPFNPEVGGQGNRRDFASGGRATNYGVSVSQEVEIAGQRSQRIEEAERNSTRVEALVRDRERLLEADLKRAFFAALAAERRLALQRAIENLNGRVRDAASARVRAGESPAMEANLAEIRYGQSRKETIAAETEVIAARLELKRLLGMPPEQAIEPSGELRGAARTVPLGEALTRALDRRPDLLAAKAELERVGAEQALTRRLRLPNPTLEGFYQTESERPGSPDRIAGGGLRIPLPVFDRKQGDLVALAAQENQARHLVDATRRTVEKEVAEALREYEAARRTVEVFEHDVLARVEENFGFIETSYREGKISLLDLVVVENDLVQAQLSYVDSLTRFRTAEADVERAVGGPLEGGVQ